MFALMGSIIVGIGLLVAINDEESMVYDWREERMVFVPNRQDMVLELWLRK